VAHDVPGVPIQPGEPGQLLFQYTIKGIKKEIATGVKKPDRYGWVAKPKIARFGGQGSGRI
jgi:hypothetical protein